MIQILILILIFVIYGLLSPYQNYDATKIHPASL